MPHVYLIGIDPPYNGKHHYIGFTNREHPAIRLSEHIRGKGGKFTSRVVRAGHTLRPIMHWSGPEATLLFERYLKDRQDTKRWCPHCRLNSREIPGNNWKISVNRWWE